VNDLYVEIRDWSLGVLSANEPDLIPNNALAKAHNSAFRRVGQGQAVIGVRPGLEVLNETAFSGTPVVHRLLPYYYNNAGTIVEYLATFANNGTLRYKEDDNDFTAVLAPPANYPFSSGTAFTSGDYAVDGTVMNNRLFAVNTNGERRSLLGTSYVPFGLSPIATVAVTAQSGGSSSMPLETYDVSVTSYNSSTGAESSTSTPVSVTTAGVNDRIRVVITPSAAETAQYTHWRIYLRRQTTQAKLYRVIAVEDVGGSAIAGAGDIAIATTTAYIDLTAAAIANHILVAPSITENNPPLTNYRFLAPYGRRLIAACRDEFYWSKLDQPDNFPPENSEPVETGEGDEITGIYLFSDELLLLFTRNQTWGLFGNDPQTWTFRPIDTTLGCVSHASVVAFDGGVGWWSDRAGPVFYDGARVQLIGLEKLGLEAVVENINPTYHTLINAGVDPGDSRVVWSVPLTNGDARCERSLPYNFRMKAWEASVWDPLDIASMGIGYDDDGVQRLFVGGYEGQVFQFNRDVQHDGVATGTFTGTFTADASTETTIAGTGFATNLVERKVTIVDADNKPIGRRRISANTTTELTLSTAINNLTSGSVYTYYIGGPDFRVYTKWIDGDQPFLRKRFDRVYLQARTSTGSPNLLASTHIDFLDKDTSAETTVRLAGDTWDTGLWDSALWAGAGSLKRRLPILKSSTALRVAILHFRPKIDVVIDKIAVLARALSDRYYD
jgi:hypothetical protein